MAQESYGRQLGKVIDALDVLIRSQSSEIDDKDRKALEALHELHDKIWRIKDEAASDRIARIQGDLKALKATDSDAYERLISDLPTGKR